jgi:outer membrane protein assembly factor BamD
MRVTRLTSIPAWLLIALALVAAGCGRAKEKVENAALPGRDKELYEDAMKKLEKGRYDESRLLFNVVITTYPDSEYLPKAKLAIADSFYLEGGSTNLEQAIGGYKDFVQYFPTHPMTCDALLKISESHMRQIIAYNRDWTNAQKANNQLRAALQKCGNSPLKPTLEANQRQVQQVLALHERDIANFYKDNRKAYKAAESRYRDIVEKYPHFNYRDEALYNLGLVLIEQEQPEEAAQFFTLLARDIPNSEYAGKAKEYLEKLGKPVPAPANDDPAPYRPGRYGQFKLILGDNNLDINPDGVLVKKKKDKEAGDEQAQAAAPAAASTPDGGAAQSIRVPPTRVGETPQSSAPQTPAPATNGAPANGNGQQSQPNGDSAQPASGGQPLTPPAAEKSKAAKPEKKKGLFGKIFRG